MRRTILTGFLLGILLLAGCGRQNPHAHSGGLIAEYCPGEGAPVTRAPSGATYVLYHWQSAPEDLPPWDWVAEHEVQQVAVRDLDRRQRIGFERANDGKLYAVAGDERILLHMGRYCWHIHPGSE